jgi:hypothetical protein
MLIGTSAVPRDICYVKECGQALDEAGPQGVGASGSFAHQGCRLPPQSSTRKVQTRPPQRDRHVDGCHRLYLTLSLPCRGMSALDPVLLPQNTTTVLAMMVTGQQCSLVT